MTSEQPEPPDKRRKIRKGTHSCWECKRRKVRCVYASPTDTVCIGCTRRCTECVSQEFPERRAPPASRSRLVGDRFVRVEAMIESLAKQTGRQPLPTRKQTKDDGSVQGVITPMSCDTPASNTAPSYSPSVEDASPGSVPEHCFPAAAEYSPVLPSSGKRNRSSSVDLRAVSEALLAAYPSQSDIDLMMKMTGFLGLYSVTGLFKTYEQIQESGNGEIHDLKIRHTPDTHPILIARQMFMLAIAMQYINPEIVFGGSGLTERPRDVMKRLADTANDLVMMDNDLMGTGFIEGLQCVCLEGLYQANTGNLRRAWLAWRRAIAVAQLMGLQRLPRSGLKALDPSFTVDPQFVWYRLLYVDRFISLILGLPQSSLDISMASESALKNETALGAFERMQCVIASKILERNERDPSTDDLEKTQAIDVELQLAASKMPSRWWLTPSFTNISDDAQMFWEITRLQNQMSHYNLLNLLHLPYILHSSSGPEQRKYDYSRITCVTASREVLKCYIVFRSFNRIAYCCRGVDFFALMASLTLLLAHLDGHDTAKHSTNNILAHQRLSDRGMMEQALENMELIATLNQDVLNAKSADLLRQILKVEADAALGSRHKLEKVTGEVRDRRGVLRIHVPYMGAIIIEREGDDSSSATSSTRETPETQCSKLTPPTRNQIDSSSSTCISTQTSHLGSISYGPGAEPSPQCPPPSSSSGLPSLPVNPFLPSSTQVQSQTQPQPQDNLPYTDTIDFPSPGLTAGVEQWAFQGVDMAFFNSLMREVDMQQVQGQTGVQGNGWV